jgi:branched-chain amino acid transport system permease protein
MKVILMSTLVLGTLYALQAVAFVLVIRGTGILNFAQGQIMALGAYLCFGIRDQFGGPFALSLVLALFLTGAIGVGLYSFVLRHFEGSPVWSVVMALFGIGIVIDSLIQIKWGSGAHFLQLPIHVTPLKLPGGFRTDSLDLVVVGFSLIFIAVLVFVVYGTSLGLRMRACADNKVVATYAGVSIGRVARISWFLASVFAALAGIAVATRTTVSPALSLSFLTAFPAVLIGGFESIVGAVVGAFILAFILQLGVTYVNSQIALALAYVILFVMLLVRPQGLFGARDIVRV